MTTVTRHASALLIAVMLAYGTQSVEPECLTLIMADKSPNGKPLFIVGNEVSGTTAVFQLSLTY